MIGEYKIDDGVVEKVAPTGLWVAPCDRPVSVECRSCGACGSTRKKKHVLFVPNTAPNRYSAGQRIRIKHYSLNEAMAAAVVFGIPLLLCVVVLVVLYAWAPSTVDSPVAVVTGLGCLVSGFGIVVATERVVRRVYPSEVTQGE